MQPFFVSLKDGTLAQGMLIDLRRSQYITYTNQGPGADLGNLVRGGGLTLFATPIIYLQHLFSKFHYQLGSPGGGGG